jgi:hypothetical protein
MSVAIFTLAVVEQIAYMAFLSRLSAVTRERRPELVGSLGAPGAWDYWVWGFGPGDRFISRLEAHRAQIGGDAQILRLMKIVRGLYVAFLITLVAWVLVIASHAN